MRLQVLAGERLNERVNAPAVLLALDFSYSRDQLSRFGGRADLGRSERSLYPHCFSLKEEAGIIARFQRATWAAACTGA